MIKKKPSYDSTWARPPVAHNSSPSSTSSTRQALLPYGPTSSSRSTTSTHLPSSSTQLRTVIQKKSSHDFANYTPPSRATFQWMRGDLIGQGSYGKVFMALNASTGELMAVKQVEFPKEGHKPAHHDALRFLAFESETLRELDHPNIVQYLGCEYSADALSVFLEYVPGGTIATLLGKFGRFRHEVTKSFTRQILEGLDYLHANGIIHRDLKPDNILVEPEGVCKISDFGISKRVDDIHNPRAHTLMKGTVQYMAPEILGSKEKGYDGKVDIWSIGCMVMEMWTGEKPWGTAEHFLSILVKLGSTQSSPPLPTQLQKGLSPDADNFRKSCFHINPVQRPSAGDLKQHPYLRLPPTWTFNEAEISHPSRERRVPLDGQKKRDWQDDGATYRLRRYVAESQDTTLRQQDIFNTAETVKQPVPPQPGPPIVIIKPVKIIRPSRSSSPVENQEQDNSTSESSNTSNSRWSGKPKRKYRVVNAEEQHIVPYEYFPPPLPPTSQPYSSCLGASSKYNVDYIPAPTLSPSSRARSSSTSRIASVQNHTSPASSSATDLTHTYSSSKSSGLSSPQSNEIDDTATWKRPPATTLLQSDVGLTPPNPRGERRHQRELRSHASAYQLRTPSASIVPSPLPPTPPSSISPLLRPNSSPSATLPQSEPKQPTIYHQPGNRPDAHDIVRDLGFYFPDHDLDQPLITVASSVDELTEDSTSAPNDVGNREDDDAHDRSRTPLQPVISGSPGRLPLLPQSSSVPRTYDHKYPTRLGPSNMTSTANTHIPRGDATSRVRDTNNNVTRSSGRKSIRRIVEERESKRLSRPGKIHRRTFWDSKMEELPGHTGSTPLPNSDEDSP